MKTILLIDQDDALALLNRILHQDIKIVRSAHLLSLPDIAALRPDMILLDHGLLGRDTEGLGIGLKSHAATREIPLVLLSLHPFIATEGVALRADAYLEMPFDLYDVASLIHKFVKI